MTMVSLNITSYQDLSLYDLSKKRKEAKEKKVRVLIIN
jgi:hypothetical protein